MITVLEAERIHEILIEKFGGAKGVRDIGALEAALNRPYQTFDGIDLYPDVIAKAAALFESLIINHPFVDGNKRIAYVLLRLTLLEGGFDISLDEDSKYAFVIDAAKGELTFEKIKKWIESNKNPIQ
jgi:death-on-curing protein